MVGAERLLIGARGICSSVVSVSRWRCEVDLYGISEMLGVRVESSRGVDFG
jgi:hypothetical protein